MIISIMVPSMLVGENDEEKEVTIDKVKLLTIGTRFGSPKLED